MLHLMFSDVSLYSCDFLWMFPKSHERRRNHCPSCLQSSSIFMLQTSVTSRKKRNKHRNSEQTAYSTENKGFLRHTQFPRLSDCRRSGVNPGSSVGSRSCRLVKIASNCISSCYILYIYIVFAVCTRTCLYRKMLEVSPDCSFSLHLELEKAGLQHVLVENIIDY